MLIESVTDEQVYYYYLENKKGTLKFTYGNIRFDKFDKDLTDVIDELDLNVDDGDAIKSKIKDAAKNIDELDQQIIKDQYKLLIMEIT